MKHSMETRLDARNLILLHMINTITDQPVDLHSHSIAYVICRAGVYLLVRKYARAYNLTLQVYDFQLQRKPVLSGHST